MSNRQREAPEAQINNVWIVFAQLWCLHMNYIQSQAQTRQLLFSKGWMKFNLDSVYLDEAFAWVRFITGETANRGFAKLCNLAIIYAFKQKSWQNKTNSWMYFHSCMPFCMSLSKHLWCFRLGHHFHFVISCGKVPGNAQERIVFCLSSPIELHF